MTDPKLKLKDSDGNPKYGSIVFSDAKLYNGEGSVSQQLIIFTVCPSPALSTHNPCWDPF